MPGSQGCFGSGLLQTLGVPFPLHPPPHQPQGGFLCEEPSWTMAPDPGVVALGVALLHLSRELQPLVGGPEA